MSLDHVALYYCSFKISVCWWISYDLRRRRTSGVTRVSNLMDVCYISPYLFIEVLG